jgi:phage repressor protein C with HTH and peptisase S24 domain
MMSNGEDITKTERPSMNDELRRFGERVKEVVGNNSARAFSRNADMSDNILRKYMEGKSDPSRGNLIAISKAGGVNLLWLATGEGPKYPEDEPTGVISNLTSDHSKPFLDEYALIPVYQVAVSAGNGSFVGDEHPEKHLAFRRRWLRWRGFDEHDLAVVMANGDSMEPTIPHKSTLVVHTGRKQPTDGNIYVIRNSDQVWVKRIQVKPGSWLLLSENKFYPPIEIPMTEQSQFEIIGQVVHISRDVGE